MITLNFSSISRRLKNCKEHNPNEVALPFGTSRENFDLFMRVMRAEKPTDIADVTTEQVIDLFKKAQVFTEVLNADPFLSERKMVSLSNCKSKSRRIL